MKRQCLMICLTLVMILSSVVPSFGATAQPELIGETAILIDMKTGEILMEKNANEQRYPASTTKVMTAILTLEHFKDLNEQLTVDDVTPYEVEGSHIALEPGEILTVHQIMGGMMTESANDCALVLGKSIAGSTEDFARMMNEKAKALGALNTNFVNPNGLHDPEHKSTAYDLVMIARYAMTNTSISAIFREFVTTYKYEIPPTNIKTEMRHLYNTNRLLYDTVNKVYVGNQKRVCKYEGVTGVKTGYTSHAGGCLIASAERNGSEFLCVTMKSTDMGRFADSIAMLDWAFTNYRTYQALNQGDHVGEVSVKRGAVKTVQVASASDIYTTIPMESPDTIVTTKVVMDTQVQAPVAKNQVVGKIQVYEGEELVGEYDAVAVEAVEKGGFLSIFGIDNATAKKIYIGFAVALLLIVALFWGYVVLKRRQIARRKARREERKKRIAEAKAQKEQNDEEYRKRAEWEKEYEKRYENRYK
ncbi:MAG: D-alanyl-D-alanine carboxypeptidase [Firmicutes bacterium]|nr:D-alanyl-D-alanine carboxypeptidase [Bacillota bacterium]